MSLQNVHVRYLIFWWALVVIVKIQSFFVCLTFTILNARARHLSSQTIFKIKSHWSVLCLQLQLLVILVARESVTFYWQNLCKFIRVSLSWFRSTRKTAWRLLLVVGFGFTQSDWSNWLDSPGKFSHVLMSVSMLKFYPVWGRGTPFPPLLLPCPFTSSSFALYYVFFFSFSHSLDLFYSINVKNCRFVTTCKAHNWHI